MTRSVSSVNNFVTQTIQIAEVIDCTILIESLFTVTNIRPTTLCTDK